MTGPAHSPPLVVMKFGGTSVSTKERWETIEALTRACLAKGERPLIVHSALSQVSNLLERAIKAALTQKDVGTLDEIKARHLVLAKDLDLDGERLIAPSIARLAKWLDGIALVGEASPRVRARILAEGEMMATALGAARLNARGLAVALFDARTGLHSLARRNTGETTHYLAAVCADTPDPDLQQRLGALGGDAVLTQGFIAGNDKGETVLLGRGGSDVSAALFAAKLQAQRLEIWTDVPGMFSTDPRLTASARLLKDLSYDEAQEIALMGAKVIHPRALPPARRAKIPTLVKCTHQPEADGTRISAQPADTNARVKAVTVKTGLVLVSMTSTSMWGEAGFLASAFAAFANNGLSIDLVSTSEASVTVSLDPGQTLEAAALDQLQADLAPLCRVNILRNCASVSLVGRGIRTILHKLTPALELFREHPVRLVSQAANDLNFTVVVEEDQAQKLARRLHDEMVEVEPEDKVFGAPWQESKAEPTARKNAHGPWWANKREALLAAKPNGEAAFVYDLQTVQTRARSLRALGSLSRVFYAMKANAQPDVLRTIAAQGVGMECVSQTEIEHAFASIPGIAPQNILFTPNFAPRDEYEAAIKHGVRLTLDNLHPLEHWPEIFDGGEILLRVDPERGRGHHRHVQTAGARAKFGIPIQDLAKAREIARAANVKIIGLHAHAGSGILDPGHWRDIAELFASLAGDFPDVKIFNLGGGLGVPENAGLAALDLARLDENLALVRSACPDIELWLEPGRFMVAEAGVLLASVTQTKTKGTTAYAGLETGMNSLIRPALYGAHHDMVNLSRLNEEADIAPISIVGPICESADILGVDRHLPPTYEGDIVLIANAGAYGAVMGSRYNLRAPAKELVLALPD
jgi:bifunctional diaminopimelate decarboxylase / aspartate kinase